MRTDFGFGYAGLILEKIFFRVLSRLGCLGANSQELAAKQKAHQMHAWGVLGSASDGLPFLLTHPVVFRSMYSN
jgi:hypothetical protein